MKNGGRWSVRGYDIPYHVTDVLALFGSSPTVCRVS